MSGTLTARDIREFNAYLDACTDMQLLGVFAKERKAGRDAYLELVKAACRKRGVSYDD